MGKRGPRQRPTALKLLNGERPDRINHDEPPAPDGTPEPPYEMNDEAREVWDYTVDQLARMGILSTADRDALVCYCEAVVTHRNATRILRRAANGGLVIRNARNQTFQRNPVVAMQRDAAVLIRAFAQEFGLTPSARSEIHTGGQSRGDLGPERLLS